MSISAGSESAPPTTAHSESRLSARLGRALLAAALGAAAWLVLAVSLPWLPGIVRYGVALVVFCGGPGTLALGLTRGSPLLERAVVILGVGTATSPLLAELLGRLGLIDLFPFLAAALTGVAVADFIRSPRPRLDRQSRVGCALIAALVVVTSLAVFGTHRLDSRPDHVTVFGDYDSVDLSYYAAMTAELTHQIPPEAPFYAGHALNYSYHPQLLLATIHKFADVPTLHLYFRYGWPGFLLIGALVAFMFIRRIATPGVATLAVCSILVGGDFSYLAARLLPHASYEWDYLLWPTNFLAPTMEILHFSTWTPTLPVLFAALYGLDRLCVTGRRGWSALAALCVAALVPFKPFAFAVLIAGLMAAAVFTRVAAARRRLGAVLIGSVALAAPWLYRIASLYEESRSRLLIDYFLLPRRMLIKLDVEDAFDRFASTLGATGRLHTAVVLLLATMLFFAGGLGVRWLGVPAVWRSLREGLTSSSIWSTLGWTVVAGITMPFVIVTEPYHDTVQFYQVALLLLWIFTAAAALRSDPRRRLRRAAVVAVTILLAIPSSMHYLIEKSGDGPAHPLASLSRSEILVANHLQTLDPERTVVLHDRPLEPSLIAILSERRVVLAWARYVTGSEARRADVDRFFGSADGNATEALDILARYHVTHVIDRLGRDRIHPDALARLRPVIRTADVVLYQVPD